MYQFKKARHDAQAHFKYYRCNQIEEGEMDRTCSTYRGDEKSRKETGFKDRHGCEDNIVTDFIKPLPGNGSIHTHTHTIEQWGYAIRF
jgi:hypothetical protein